MMRTLISAGLYLLANSVGLLLAMALLPGFRIDVPSFITAVLLFTVIEVVASPLLTKMSLKNLPALSGGVALVTTCLGLVLTSHFLDGMDIGGLKNLLLATLIVWLGALLAGVFLPMVLFKKYLQNRRA